jgi:hypothetical protein
MHLSHKSNIEIEAELHRIVKRERSAVIESVLYFSEIVKRNIHLSGKHSSLYAYMVNMGFTRDQALVRKDAVQLLLELPQLTTQFINGAFTISSLHHMRQVFRREARRRKKEKLSELTSATKLEVARKLIQESSRDTRRMLAEEFPECHLSIERTRPVADGKTEILFSCDDEELKVFNELKDIYGHKNHERSWQVLFADLAKDALKRHKKLVSRRVDEQKVGTPEYLPICRIKKLERDIEVFMSSAL